MREQPSAPVISEALEEMDPIISFEDGAPEFPNGVKLSPNG